MLDAIEQGNDSPLTYDVATRSYRISAPKALMKKNMRWLGYNVKFCPFCCIKLPKDLTDEWCEILDDDYDINPYDEPQKKRMPAEFKTDEWWKKRGL